MIDDLKVADADDIPLEDIDVSQHHLFRSLEVLPLFARLRHEAPVHYCRESQFGPYWSLTRYDDIARVNTDHRTFSSSWEYGGIVLDDAQIVPPEGGKVISAFIALDEPDHRKYRRAVQPIVSPQSLRGMEALVRQRTRTVLDALPVGEDFDWVDKVSVELTMLMLCTLFDVPVEDRGLLNAWGEAATTLEGMDGFVSHEARMAQLGECLHYFTHLWNERVNAPPKFDLISMLAHDPGTSTMEPFDYLSQVIMLIVGGNDTTRNSMSASINAIDRFPDQYAKVRDDRSLIGNMVDEVIRWHTPVAHMRRTALTDVEIGGQRIAKGDKVVMWYYSGNRDEDVFPDGEAIRLDRANIGRHLSFGYGIHRCMGMAIAKLQLRILWEEMLDRFTRFELVAPPKRNMSCQINGYREVMVRLAA